MLNRVLNHMLGAQVTVNGAQKLQKVYFDQVKTRFRPKLKIITNRGVTACRMWRMMKNGY